MLKNILLVVSIFSITSCTNHSNKTLDNNSDQKIAEMITTGKTTKDEITAKFGKPETMAKNKEGQDVWVYADDETNYLNPLNIIPVTRTLIGTTGKEKKLVITFYNEIVYDYVLTNKSVRTKNGLLTMGSSKD
jgi:hypothetical protein